MSESICSYERRIAEAARRGLWQADLTAHIERCASCADLALASGWLHATEAPRELAVDLEQASRIWRGAEAERRREQAARALLPVAIGELAACILGGVALIVYAARYLGPLAQESEAVGLELLADPVVLSLSGVATLLLAGVSFVWAALAVGFGVDRS